jgi:hypothetical protein
MPDAAVQTRRTGGEGLGPSPAYFLSSYWSTPGVKRTHPSMSPVLGFLVQNTPR